MPSNSPTGESGESCLISTEAPLEEPAVRDRLRDCSHSAKLVAQTLADDSPLATGEIAGRSLLPPRTARHALDSLDEAGLVESDRNRADGRTKTYVLISPGTEGVR